MRNLSDIGWEPDGTVLITFIDTRNIRCEGHVAVRQTIRIEPTKQYASGIQAIVDAGQELLRDALADWSDSPALEDTEERVLGTEPRQPTPAHDDDDEEALAARQWAAIVAARDAT